MLFRKRMNGGLEGIGTSLNESLSSSPGPFPCKAMSKILLRTTSSG